MTLNIDVAPTLLDFAGIKAPPSMQGRSVRGNPPPRTEWFYEHAFTAASWIPQTQGVRTERWKYTRYLDTKPVFEELYDLKSDSAEKRNLASQAEHAQQLTAMRGRWEHWRSLVREQRMLH
jgi:arylsulfatase A-like enzyme